MRNITIIALCGLLLSGCFGVKELKAPCGYNDYSCLKRYPVNHSYKD